MHMYLLHRLIAFLLQMGITFLVKQAKKPQCFTLNNGKVSGNLKMS